MWNDFNEAHGWPATESPTSYIFSKMGYNTLSGDVLNYVNDETRLGLSPSGVRQYAYKIVEDAQ